MYSDVVAEAGKEARKAGGKLVHRPLQDLFKTSGRDLAMSLSAEDALGLVIYESDWRPELADRLGKIRTLLQEQQKPVRNGIWLLGKGKVPVLPAEFRDWPGFDAISSASTERPGKAAAQKFFPPLLLPLPPQE